MRLSNHYAATIRDAARKVFGADAIVRLFGSRVDDCTSGGDIDLHVETSNVDMMAVPRFRAELWKRLDEEQVDVVVHQRGTADGWIDRAARRDGIIL